MALKRLNYKCSVIAPALARNITRTGQGAKAKPERGNLDAKRHPACPGSKFTGRPGNEVKDLKLEALDPSAAASG